MVVWIRLAYREIITLLPSDHESSGLQAGLAALSPSGTSAAPGVPKNRSRYPSHYFAVETPLPTNLARR